MKGVKATKANRVKERLKNLVDEEKYSLEGAKRKLEENNR